MSTALTAFVQDGTYTQEQVELIKQQVAKDATDMELALFLTVCKSTGLDPFRKQIYAIKRSGKMTIQTGIDGYRLLADRTGRYAPGQATTFEYVEGTPYPYSATAYVRKYASGTWIEYSATALWAEYVQGYDGKPSGMWVKMAHTMLGKCAEALALRRGFPGELSGIYTADEMQQADGVAELPPTRPQPQLVEIVDMEREIVIDQLKERMRTFKREFGNFPINPNIVRDMTTEQIRKEIQKINDAIDNPEGEEVEVAA